MKTNPFLLLVLAQLGPKKPHDLLELLLQLQGGLDGLSVDDLDKLDLQLNLEEARSDLLALRNLLEGQDDQLNTRHGVLVFRPAPARINPDTSRHQQFPQHSRD